MIARVQDYMSSVLHTVRPEDSIGSAFKKLALNRIRHLLVVDGVGRLQGIITETDLLRAFRDRLGAVQTGQPTVRCET